MQFHLNLAWYKPANKGLFTQQLVTASSESKSEEPPRDYSEGSSGLLKTDKETNNN